MTDKHIDLIPGFARSGIKRARVIFCYKLRRLRVPFFFLNFFSLLRTPKHNYFGHPCAVVPDRRRAGGPWFL